MQNRAMMMKCPAVKVYTASVDCLEDPSLLGKWLVRVPALRREKAESLRNPAVRRLSLGAGALLTCALLDHFTRPDETSWDPADPEGSGKDTNRSLLTEKISLLRLEEDEHGRPYLPDHPEICFSLSHSGNRVMCAISEAGVGCDVEMIKETGPGSRNISRVARCFTPAEQKLVLADPENFYRIWTLKESFLKLIGEGLRLPLSSFEITLDPLSIRQDIISDHINMKEYGQIGGYQYSCMSVSGTMTDRMISVDLNDLR